MYSFMYFHQLLRLAEQCEAKSFVASRASDIQTGLTAELTIIYADARTRDRVRRRADQIEKRRVELSRVPQALAGKALRHVADPTEHSIHHF